MFDIKDGDFDDSVEINLEDKIKSKLIEGFNVGSLITIILKLSIIAIGPIALKMIEVININKLKKDLNKVQLEAGNVQNEINKIEAEIQKYAGSKDKKKDFESKEKILNKLAQERLKIIGILDHLQQAVDVVVDEKNPSKFIVLDRVTVNNSDIKIDAKSNDDGIIGSFLSELESENIYSSVRLEQISSQDTLKKFLVTGLFVKDEESAP